MKAKHPDAILLFRVGDVYEVYEQDATELYLTFGLPIRQPERNGKRAHVASFHYSQLGYYLPKLIIKAGKRVAICEQLEDTGLKHNRVN